jgi:tetratricopeptide (TPR) repeat protein
MKFSGKFPFALATLVAVMATAQPVRADDIAADLATAQGLFEAQRQDSAVLEQVIASLNAAVARADNPEQKYAALLLLSQSQYFKGMHLPDATTEERKQARLRTFDAGIAACDAANVINRASFGDQRSECYYFKAINLGRWGETHGLISFPSISRRHEYRRSVIDAMNFRRGTDTDDALLGPNGQPVPRRTGAGRPGVSYEGYGPYRAMGRMYHRLPPGFGRDLQRAETMLRDCVRLAGNIAINHNYLAEVLWEEGKQDQAREVLRNLLANDEATFNPERLPETRDEFVEARKLLRSYGG